MTQENPNLAIWNRAFQTDPKFTKQFQRTGGFKGTAINATWLAKRATEEFGPCGIGWGVRVVHEQMIQGHPVYNAGNLEGHTQIHTVLIEFWYRPDAKEYPNLVGSIHHFGQTEMVGRRASGQWFTDEEAPKKSITDATSKALSMLGFAGDVYMGLYDDNKYVNDLKNAAVKEEKPSKAPPKKAAKPEPREEAADDTPPNAEEVKAMIEAAETVEALQDAASRADKRRITPTEMAKLGALYQKRLKELKA